MCRNTFGPVRGPWADDSWRGWWGDEPPFGHDVFVRTHHPRADLVVHNGTTFHFVDATPSEAMALAADAVGGKDVALGGGVATVRAFLAAGLVDELHLAIAPVLLGSGERLFGPELAGYAASGLQCSGGVAHVHLRRVPPDGAGGHSP